MGQNNRDNFELKWKDFHANIATSFRGLREDDEFLDVTVACDEDNQLQAHKVILAACSPYFRAMLRKNKTAHPVLIMPDNVRFVDVVSLIDFMYHGEVSVQSEELSSFMAVAKQFKVRGLHEEDGTGAARPTKVPGQVAPKPAVPARTVPQSEGTSSVPPEIRQRLPPGIQMVKRGSGEGSPMKRPRLGPEGQGSQGSGGQGGKGNGQSRGGFQDEDDSGDDITEIREGEDSNDYNYEGYDYEEGAMGYEGEGGEGSQMPPPDPRAPQMIGLVCPNCRQMCQGVQALKDHMQVCKGGGGAGRGGQPGGPGQMGGQPQEEPQECHICDKSFKSHRTLDNHMKKQHGLAAPPKPMHTGPKGRGRPKKGPMMSDRPGGWQGEGGYAGEHGQYSDQGGQGGSQPGTSKGRPVGQVAPAQRNTDSPAPSKTEGKPVSSSGEPGYRNLPSPRGGRGRGSPIGRGQGFRPGGPKMGEKGADGQPKPDLQKLGLKFGGQISITSTGNQGKRGGMGGGDTQGVSVTKLKGDVPVGAPVSIRDATNTRGGPGRSTPGQEGSKKGDGEADSQSAVKEEPKDFEEGEGDDAEVGEDGAGDDFGNYGDGDEGDYMGPGGDGLYGEEGDYVESGDPDQEGMDIEYFSQYKGGDRDEFERGGGMFQGEYGEGDPDMDGEYEEEG